MSTSQIILIAVVVVFVLVVIGLYNTLVQLKIKVQEAFSTMDVYLKKRYDLIPNLVAVVKGYASHEADVLLNVAEVRSNATERKTQLDGEAQITSALVNIMAVVENYPELRANKNFLQLQSQLVQLEEDIASSRRYYNGSVRMFNDKCQTIPTNIVASILGYKPMPMFEAKEVERKNTQVNI